jgi:NodT family efflux transporter outer membrane factor (OMF) lipoprotein
MTICRLLGHRPGLAGVVIPLMLAACSSLGPDYLRPESAVSETWTEKTAQNAQWPSIDWWTGFNSPRLDDYMRQSQQANFDIAAAVARVRQADAQVRISGAALLPSVQLSSGASRSGTPNLSYQKKSSTQENVFNVVFGASYELDFWGANADAVEAAQATARGSRFDQQTVALTVQANVANTYFTILSLQDRLAVARDNLAIAEHTLEAIRARETFGTASGLDVAQQESVVAEQRAAIPPLVQQLRQNTFALAILLGKTPESVTIPLDTLDSVSLPAVSPGLPSELLARRPDVQSAEAQLIAANANMKEAKAALFPTITLTTQGGLESPQLSKLFDPTSLLFSLAASAVQPIFKGGALEGGIQLEQARYEELVQTYRKTVISAFGDVDSALVAVEMSGQQETAQRLAVETARRAYEISQAQLLSGTIDIVTVLNTQKTLFSDQDLLVQDKLAHAQALVGLFRVLGGGWRAEEQPATAGS